MRTLTFAWTLVAASVFVVGCGLPQDSGVVMGCFGLINQTVPGQGVPSDQVVTNLYFGGCNPADPGMQIIERVTPGAATDQVALAAACDADCNGRLAAYALIHPEAKLPLGCQTLFAASCDGLGADISELGTATTAFQAGGPADMRIALTGTVSLNFNGSTAVVPASGIVDLTFGPCTGAGQSCVVDLTRFDLTASQPFLLAGVTVDTAQVQNQGRAVGQRTPSEFLIPTNAVETEVSFTTGGIASSFHVKNDQPIRSVGPQPDPAQVLSNLDLTMGNGAVHIVMHGTPAGLPPVASFTPRTPTFECTCKECTPVSFTSTSTDVDLDLQSLAWLLDGKVQPADGTSAPPSLDLAMPLGAHQVSLVATDTRGAVNASSFNFSVVDTTPPVITLPPNVNLLSCSFPEIGQATATDTCSDVVVVVSDSSGNFHTGTNIVTWIAQDSSFNEARATQTVTVQSVPDANCCPSGTNILRAPASGGTVNGTPGPDCIIGSSNNDVLNGLGGNDYIIGNGGQDVINGGDGDDVLLGGDGDDIIDGGGGNDRIAGGTGQDRLTGGVGNDTIVGGDGDDTINGNDGDDRIFGNQGQDHVFAGNGNDTIEGGFGDGQTLNGEAGDDRILGFVNNDVINGGPGNDFIAGFDGDDHLDGGADNDTILGGRGHNVCTSGGGTDSVMCLP